MDHCKGKKLLIIGGAFQHCKLVEAARQLGVITYVTDYLQPEQAPAKQMADHYEMYNITQIDEIVDWCRREGIDGVIATSLDACQKPYQEVCHRLGLPCFGTREQFDILTDKTKFKACCREYGVDVIPEYAEEDFLDRDSCLQKVTFPILVKPGESRGSRGQSICRCYEDTAAAIALARKESANGRVVIEKYMGQSNDFSMTILMLNGKAHAFRTVDRILGSYEDGLDKLAVGATMPSVFTELYMQKVHSRVEALYRGIGLVNAPVFMQGFVDGDTVRFYDPGLRLPGGEYERMFLAATGVNPFFPLIEFALTGQVTVDSTYMPRDSVMLKGKFAAQLLPALRPGVIAEITGMEEIRGMAGVVSAFPRFCVGEEVKATGNVNQRFCEIDLVCHSPEALKALADRVFATLSVRDAAGQEMLISRFDTEVILRRGAQIGS